MPHARVGICPIARCTTTDDLGNPLLISTPVCDHHRNRVLATLRAIPALHLELSLAMAPTAGTRGGERVSTGEIIRLPINTEARCLQEDLLRLLEHTYEDLAGIRTRQHRGTEPGRLKTAATVLLAHPDETLATPEFPQTLLKLAAKADRLLGKGTPAQKLPTPCGACGCLSLIRPAGSDDVHCRACEGTYTAGDYLAHTRLILEQEAA